MPVVKADKEQILIRKFFKTYRFKYSDFESYYFGGSNLEPKCTLIFCGKAFTFPTRYRGFRRFLRAVRVLNSLFCTEEGIEALKEYIKARTAKTVFPLVAKIDAPLVLTNSKIGGVPYWDLHKEYPVDSEGKKMQLLCQLNFEECKIENDLLPQKGLLQFFISADSDCYGVAGASIVQDDWRFVFHEEIDPNISEKDIQGIVINPSEIEISPVLKPCALGFSAGVSYMQCDDAEMRKLLKSAVKELTGNDFEGDLYDLLGSSDINIHAEQIYRLLEDDERSHILGYPYFIQYDFREDYDEVFSETYDTVLLQLNSADENGNLMCWGDSGIGTFMINSAALKNRDFSKVVYYWECY